MSGYEVVRRPLPLCGIRAPGTVVCSGSMLDYFWGSSGFLLTIP